VEGHSLTMLGSKKPDQVKDSLILDPDPG
jgi:hypothetical protein